MQWARLQVSHLFRSANRVMGSGGWPRQGQGRGPAVTSCWESNHPQVLSWFILWCFIWWHWWHWLFIDHVLKSPMDLFMDNLSLAGKNLHAKNLMFMLWHFRFFSPAGWHLGHRHDDVSRRWALLRPGQAGWNQVGDLGWRISEMIQELASHVKSLLLNLPTWLGFCHL